MGVFRSRFEPRKVRFSVLPHSRTRWHFAFFESFCRKEASKTTFSSHFQKTGMFSTYFLQGFRKCRHGNPIFYRICILRKPPFWALKMEKISPRGIARRPFWGSFLLKNTLLGPGMAVFYEKPKRKCNFRYAQRGPNSLFLREALGNWPILGSLGVPRNRPFFA